MSRWIENFVSLSLAISLLVVSGIFAYTAWEHEVDCGGRVTNHVEIPYEKH